MGRDSIDEFKEDRAGHQRQVRHAQERVILTALAVWPEGGYHAFHYEVAEDENEARWLAFFDHLIARRSARQRSAWWSAVGLTVWWPP